MRIISVTRNNRKRGFEVQTRSGTFWYPYAKLRVRPRPGEGVTRVNIDRELGGEAFTYTLRSGRECTVHVEQVLEYNKDPSHMRDLVVYELTLEARRRVSSSRLSRREIIRRLGTSATQFYRLLDQTNYSKSIDQLLLLLAVLDCDVDVTVRPKSA